MKSTLSMKLAAATAAAVVVALCAGNATAAWAPGLAGGHYRASDYGKASYNTDGIWLTGAPAVTNACLGPYAATNNVSSSSDTGACPPIWAQNRTWVYAGQMFLRKGTHWFCGQIDDARWVKLDGRVIMNNTSWSACAVSDPGYTVTEDDGRWVDIEIRMANGGGGAGYNSGVKDANGLLCGFGHAVADAKPSATMANFVYPCDPGDRSVFRHDDGFGWNDMVQFTALPKEYAVPGVSYAATNGVAAGDTFTLSVPAGTHTVADGVRVTCVGHKVYSVNIETKVKTLVAEGDSNAFTYTHPTDAMGEVVWLWHVENRISVAAGEGGTVSSVQPWVVPGAATTVTATPDAGHHFYRWTGDVPYGQVFSPTLMLDYRRPVSVTALFEADGEPGAKVYTGASNGKWSVDSNWRPAGVPTRDDAVFIRASVNVELDCVADVASLVVSNGACVSANFASGKIATRTRDAASLAAGGKYGIRSRGDVTLLGNAKIYLGGYGMATNYFEVGGDLSLAGTANELALYAGPCGPSGTAVDWFNGGMRASVGGRTSIAKGCWIYTYAHARPATASADAVYATGAPVVLDLGDLSVASGGGVSASGLGWGSYSSNPAVANASSNLGGGYGGKGGGPGYGPYGYALAPFYPGMKGGNNGAGGGGSVRIAAKDVTLAGSLLANSSAEISRQGSGGGIWLTCDTLDASGATVSAKSQAKEHFSGDYASFGSGGGGGRVAIGLGLASWQIERLVADGEADGLAVGTVAEILGAAAPATLSVAGSTGAARSAADDGADGTAVAYVGHDDAHVALFVTTDAGTVDAPGAAPALGAHVLAAGASANGAAFPAFAFSADGSLRHACAGWTLTFADGTSASGEGATVAGAPALAQDATLVWHLASTEARPTFSAVGDATATGTAVWGAIGSKMSITAAAGDEAFEFQYWIGDVPYSNRYDNPLVVPARGHFKATAFFGRKIGAAIQSVNADNGRAFFNAANWVGGVIPGTNDSAVVYSSGTKQMMQVPAFFAVRNLAVSNAYLLVNTSYGYDDNPASLQRSVSNPVGRNRHAVLDQARTEPFGFDVSGDLLLDKGGYIYVGGRKQNACTKVSVGGDMTLRNGYYLQWGGYHLATPAADHAAYYPLPSLAPYFRGFNTLDVGGVTTIRSGSWIVPMSDYRTGVTPWMTFRDVVVDAGGGFNGSHAGFGRHYHLGTRTYYTCPAGASSADNYNGGAHAGLGGNNSGSAASPSYNTSLRTYGFENAPLYPGGPKHSWRDDANNGGGGAIHFDADTLTLNGKIMATCGEDNVAKGGKAGGAVWINVRNLAVGDDAFVSVAGGKSTGGGGGGGRAAICIGLTDAQMERLAFSDGHTAEGVSIAPLADVLGEKFTAAGGVSTSKTPGQDGTGVYIVNTSGKKVLTVAGLPANIGAVDPPYGPNTFADGLVTNATAPAVVAMTDDGLTRRLCTGYTVSNETTGAVVSGAGNSVSIEMTAPQTLTWLFETLQHSVDVSVEGAGAVVTNAISDASSVWQADGFAYSLTAVPAEGHVFAGWTGDVPVDLREGAALELTADRGRAPVAVFVTDAAGDKVWTGEGDGASWYDAANWDPVGVPGPRSRVTIPAGFTVTADYGIPVLAGSLSVAAGSTLNVRTPSTFSTDARPATLGAEADFYRAMLRVGGDFALGGTLNLGRKHSLSVAELAVGGAFALGEGAVFNAFAGYRPLYWNTAEGWDAGGGTVTVGGAMTLAPGAWVYPWCNGLRGAPVVFDVGSLSVAADAGFNATGKGYTYTIYDSVLYCYCPGIMTENNYAGATFAAFGGKSTSDHVPRSTVYGSAVAPFVPGCCSRNDGGGTFVYGTGYSGGGGAIRIRSRGAARIMGTLVADGQAGFGSQGGGSGGAIWVTAPRVRLSEESVVRAVGGGNGSGGGCGSGGRICIAEGLSDAQIAAFIATGTATGKFTVHDLVADASAKASLAKGTFTAAGGFKAAGSAQNGGDGSEIWITAPPAHTIFFIR